MNIALRDRVRNRLARTWSRLRRDDEISSLREENARLKRRLRRRVGSDLDAPVFAEDRIIWMFGSKRTGSTWLSNIMDDVSENHSVWREPRLGLLYGYLYYEYGTPQARERMHKSKNFCMGSQRDSWLRSVKYSVLEGAASRFSDLLDDGYVVIKEPNGSVGAPILAAATPKSSVLLLVRDPRDVLASVLDAAKPGSWSSKRTGKEFVAQADGHSRNIMKLFSRSVEAFDDHPGPKLLVRYEDLVSDTESSLKRIYGDLDIEVGSDALRAAIVKNSWENIPAGDKGEGRFYRKGTPGSWKEDLSTEEATLMEEIAKPFMQRFDYQ